jgi:hypothetical protein
MEVEKIPSFTIEGFLFKALENFPEVDKGEKKEDTIKLYSQTLRKVKLSGEKTLHLLKKEDLVGLGIPLGHAAAIAETALNWGKKDQQQSSISLPFEQMKKELKEIQHSLSEIKLSQKTSFTPSTYTQRYQRMQCEIKTPWFNAVKNVEISKPVEGTKKKVSVFAIPPEIGASETQEVQPWWECVTKNLKDDPNLKIDLQDEHKHPTIGDRKPDLIGWEKRKPHNPYYIVVVGELKGRRKEGKDNFTDEEKGKMESFLEDLIHDYQQHRVQVTGFLSDGYLIQFFLLENHNNNLKLWETPVYLLNGEGGEYLIGLLSTVPSQLGMQSPLQVNNQEVFLNKVLGLGGSSVVYEGTYNNKTVVVKHFRPNNNNKLISEVNNLKLVEKLGDNVTKHLYTTDDKSALLLSPVGIQLASILDDYKNTNKIVANSFIFNNVISILEKVHKIQLVHRDITLSNIFILEKEDSGVKSKLVFLNDWGCAVPMGVQTTFSGSLQFAPDRVLKLMLSLNDLVIQYEPRPEDDLEMLVKCLSSRINPEFERWRTVPSTVSGIKKLFEFWQQQLSPNFWKNMLHLAQQLDYGEMKNKIMEFLA